MTNNQILTFFKIVEVLSFPDELTKKQILFETIFCLVYVSFCVQITESGTAYFARTAPKGIKPYKIYDPFLGKIDISPITNGKYL